LMQRYNDVCGACVAGSREFIQREDVVRGFDWVSTWASVLVRPFFGLVCVSYF
jgi:hypothetical protein